MILKRFYDEPLAQASYLLGCPVTGEALVVDPLRDVSAYLEFASAEALDIKHVTETHIHADFLSGIRELSSRTGAHMYLSGEGGQDWSYRFAASDRATLLEDGDHFWVGKIRIDVMHTPGHTPEHLTFLVTDTTAANEPMGAFTGDFLFVGDVGRPDLLEKAAGLEGTMEVGARDLYRSLQRLRKLDDWLQVWPGHGAGSACGKSLGAVPMSTLGYERRFNWAFSYDDPDAFVTAVLRDQPEPPIYFAQMKRLNRDGPPILEEAPSPRTLGADDVGEILAGDSVLVDTRARTVFESGHLPGALSLPLDRQFTTSAGWVLPYDRSLVLIVDGPGEARRAIRDLRTIGLDRTVGLLPSAQVTEWIRDEGIAETVGRVSTSKLAAALDSGAFQIVDVRSQGEWDSGHLPGARHIPLGHLPNESDQLDADVPAVVYCATGGRSGIAASVIQALGFKDVRNLDGGLAQWIREGRPVERESATSDPASPQPAMTT